MNDDGLDFWRGLIVGLLICAAFWIAIAIMVMK